MSTFAYVYFMKDDPQGVRAAVAAHVSHWRSLGMAEYRGGPFADHSGGLITFAARDAEEAQRAVATDPFFARGLLEYHWLKEWRPE